MDFLVLGTFEVWRDGERIALPSLRHQRVLAALLTAPNAVVPLPRLIDALWEEDPPATAAKQVRNCVSALRDRMGAPAKELIVTDGPGYRLVVTEDQLDAPRFRTGMTAARALAADGRVADAVERARSALRLWRGPAFDGLATSILSGHAARLDEQRLVAIEDCVDWRLALGDHRAVIDELAELVVEHPLRERPHAQLMTAYARGGRQTDALAVYQGLRARLADELGIDPGAGIRDLHGRILRGEIEHSVPAPPGSIVDTVANGLPDPPTEDGLDRAVRELAAALAHQWRTEAEMRSLHRPEPVRITWSSTERRVTAAMRPNSDPNGVSRGELADVVAAFRKAPSRQLVVLGEPGAGKSVLAIELTLGLLADPEPGEPIPVLMPLASWDPHREHLHAWLARKLIEEYPGLANTAAYGPDAATRLVVEGHVLPVLDGLDETPPGVHAAAIDALDQAVSSGRPVVLTCRGAEYEAAVRKAGAFLARAEVVELEPVELDHAIAFLTARERLGEQRWRPVAEHLRGHQTGALAQALRTPLMVDLARSAYAHPATDPRELCDTARFPDRAAIEDHLLDMYLPTVYADQPVPPGRRERRYDPARASSWLTFLARHLDQARTRDLAWWRLDRAVPRPARGLLLGLPPAVLFAITGWLGGGPRVGFVYGISFAVAGCVAHTIGQRRGPMRVELQFRTTAVRFAVRFAIGTAIGTGLAFAWSVTTGAMIALALVFGLAVGMYAWLDSPADANRVSSPDTVLRNDRVAGLAFTLSLALSMGVFFGVANAYTHQTRFVTLFGGTFDLVLAVAGGLAAAFLGRFLLGRVGCVAYGIAGGLVSGQVFTPSPDPVAVATIGLMAGLAVGLAVCLSRAWGAFAGIRLWLAARGRLPLRLMRFLEDAHRRGVLRQVGAVYQFRHARLQDRLSATGQVDAVVANTSVRLQPSELTAADPSSPGQARAATCGVRGHL